MNTRLAVVHFAGDYRAAYELRRDRGAEVYYGHGYMLDQLHALSCMTQEVAFMCCLAPKYCQRLPEGGTVMGLDTNPYRHAAPVLAALDRFAPTHLIVHGPMRELIAWGVGNDIATGVMLADSFRSNRIEQWVRWRWLASALNDPRVTLVANHGKNAARDLIRMGVRADRVIAWDYPHVSTPVAFAAKARNPAPAAQLLYVGSIERRKGVGDLIRATAVLAKSRDVRLTVVGRGNVEQVEAQARRLGIGDRVSFAGTVPNGQVLGMMRGADVVVVPSRHSFSEGLPLTLFEAMASRTPTVASDHPMFVGNLRNGEDAVLFRAGHAADMARAIAALLDDHSLYARVSAGSAAAWQRMQVPAKWGAIVEHWVRGSAADRTALEVMTLGNAAS